MFSGRCADMEIVPGKMIGSSHPCFIIAEVGQNHQGNLQIAKKLIEAAKESGADCVKFQKTSINDKFNALALARPYRSQHSWGQTYGEHKKFLEFSFEEFKHLQSYAEKTVGIPFTSSAMDMSSLDFLDSLNVPFIKIGSGDANNLPLLKYAAEKKRPLIISTGMQNMATVRKVYNSVKNINPKFCLLHCVSAYPTQPKEVNLNVLVTYMSEFPDVHIGYSGHELGTTISTAAVTIGAKILERHITLNKEWKGNDHACSLTPNEFKELVDKIRLVETAMGSFVKEVQTGEIPCIEKLGKTVVATRFIQEGEILDGENIIAKVAEPKGLTAQDMDMMYGKRIRRSIAADESIFYEDVF